MRLLGYEDSLFENGDNVCPVASMVSCSTWLLCCRTEKDEWVMAHAYLLPSYFHSQYLTIKDRLFSSFSH